MKTITDFTPEQRKVIAERRKYQSNVELGKVFGCRPITIAAIARVLPAFGNS